jgi:thiamine biosynthesis lipoprotein
MSVANATSRGDAAAAGASGWTRRARPLLGTIVEVGVRRFHGIDPDAALSAAFDTVADVQRCLSRFDVDSDVSRFHSLRSGEELTMRPAMQKVLAAADELRTASDGAFDITGGTGAHDWRCEGDRLRKLSDTVRFDLGGIGKGFAIDCAVRVLLARGVDAGFVNAGGDLRAFGDADVPVHLRDEHDGGVRFFATLGDGAFATSHFDRRSRSGLMRPDHLRENRAITFTAAHVSVAAPLCLWADALTKIVAIHGDASHPLLARYDARAWLH